jgi:hypothetical protein
MALILIDPGAVEKYLKMEIEGGSGTGKSHTMLLLMDHLAKLFGYKREQLAIVDSEYGRIIKKPRNMWEGFKYFKLDHPTFEDYREALVQSYKMGVKIIGFDSFSHAYKAYIEKGQAKGGNYASWGEANKAWEYLMEAVNKSPLHILVTARLEEKVEVSQIEDSKGNKKTNVVKLGLNPELRKGSAYDFDLCLRMEIIGKVHTGTFIKDNNHWGLQDQEFEFPGERLAGILHEKMKDTMNTAVTPKAEAEATDGNTGN